MITTFGNDDKGNTTVRIAGTLIDVKAEMVRIAAECVAKDVTVRFMGPYQWRDLYVTHGEIWEKQDELRR